MSDTLRAARQTIRLNLLLIAKRDYLRALRGWLATHPPADDQSFEVSRMTDAIHVAITGASQLYGPLTAATLATPDDARPCDVEAPEPRDARP